MDYTNQLNEVNENLEYILEALGNIRDNSYFHSAQLENIEIKIASGENKLNQILTNQDVEIQGIGLIGVIGILFIIYYFVVRCFR